MATNLRCLWRIPSIQPSVQAGPNGVDLHIKEAPVPPLTAGQELIQCHELWSCGHRGCIQVDREGEEMSKRGCNDPSWDLTKLGGQGSADIPLEAP